MRVTLFIKSFIQIDILNNKINDQYINIKKLRIYEATQT